MAHLHGRARRRLNGAAANARRRRLLPARWSRPGWGLVSALVVDAGEGRPRAGQRRVLRAGLGAVVLLLVVCAPAAPALAVASTPPALTPPAAAATSGTDGGVPGLEVRPGWDDAPGQAKIISLLNVTAQVGLACCIASVAIGGAALGIGRATGGGPVSGRGLGMVLGGGGGAVLIKLAPALIGWLSR